MNATWTASCVADIAFRCFDPHLVSPGLEELAVIMKFKAAVLVSSAPDAIYTDAGQAYSCTAHEPYSALHILMHGPNVHTSSKTKFTVCELLSSLAAHLEYTSCWSMTKCLQGYSGQYDAWLTTGSACFRHMT